MVREWATEFGSHRIRVTNSWFTGAQLFIDDFLSGEKAEAANNPKEPAFSMPLAYDRGTHLEVFLESKLPMRAKILVNGQKLAGDLA